MNLFTSVLLISYYYVMLAIHSMSILVEQIHHYSSSLFTLTVISVFYRMEDMTYGSFVAQMGYKHHFCAADIVYCITALLEHNVCIYVL